MFIFSRLCRFHLKGCFRVRSSEKDGSPNSRGIWETLPKKGQEVPPWALWRDLSQIARRAPRLAVTFLAARMESLRFSSGWFTIRPQTMMICLPAELKVWSPWSLKDKDMRRLRVERIGFPCYCCSVSMPWLRLLRFGEVSRSATLPKPQRRSRWVVYSTRRNKLLHHRGVEDEGVEADENSEISDHRMHFP